MLAPALTIDPLEVERDPPWQLLPAWRAVRMDGAWCPTMNRVDALNRHMSTCTTVYVLGPHNA